MAKKSVNEKATSVSRRNFLAVGGVGVIGLTLGGAKTSRKSSERAVIQIVMNGGASHLDTFDPKPDAPREIRGPIHSIETSVPGIRFSECLPKLAERANQLVVLRSLHHTAAPIHETGLQLLLTGGMVKLNQQPPHIGFVLQRLLKSRRKLPVAVELGGRLSNTGVRAYHGTQLGLLGETSAGEYLPNLDDLGEFNISAPDFNTAKQPVKEQYGQTKFGELLWTAARLVEAGVKYITVHTFNELEGSVTWDAHGHRETAPGTIFDYRDTLGPQFDRACGGLLDDLNQADLIKQTLIVCSGEMGRSPRINENQGRDHWTNVWSGFLAGGGLSGGQVIGASDESGEEIKDHPIELQRLPALVFEYLGIPPGTEIPVHETLTWKTPEASLVLS